nr:MAG TPA: hypothetical protein [Caudoviricetes sp.]
MERGNLTTTKKRRTRSNNDCSPLWPGHYVISCRYSIKTME